MGTNFLVVIVIILATMAVNWTFREVVKSTKAKEKYQSYLTRVHIAGDPQAGIQRCSRCGFLLVDVSHDSFATVSKTEEQKVIVLPGFWLMGEYVGVLESKNGTKINPKISFTMAHDAKVDEESEEIACS